MAAVADRYGVARGLVYQWLRQVREGHMPGLSLKEPEAAATFAPVSIVSEGRDSRQGEPMPTPSLPPPPSRAARQCQPPSGAVAQSRFRLANGRVIKVDESIEPDALALLLVVVDGDRT